MGKGGPTIASPVMAWEVEVDEGRFGVGTKVSVWLDITMVSAEGRGRKEVGKEVGNWAHRVPFENLEAIPNVKVRIGGGVMVSECIMGLHVAFGVAFAGKNVLQLPRWLRETRWFRMRVTLGDMRTVRG